LVFFACGFGGSCGNDRVLLFIKTVDGWRPKIEGILDQLDDGGAIRASFYYNLDATGQVLPVRIRHRGTQRGVALVNYEAMSRFLAKAVNQSTSTLAEQTESRPVTPTPPAGNVYRLIQRHQVETELMRRLTPILLHYILRTISDLEELVRAAGHA
jgi:hypothetical protein